MSAFFDQIKQKKFSPVAIAAGLLAIIIVVSLIPDSNNQQRPRGGATTVGTETIKESPFTEVVEALGTAKANESVVITVQSTKLVSDILFEDSQTVGANQLLVKLDSREEEAKVKELEVNLQEDKRQLQRLKGLAIRNATSKQLVEEQQAKVNAMKAQLEVASTKLSQLKIRAPFKGQLGIRQVSKGALVKPGDQITTLDDLEKIKVDFSLAEIHIPTVKPGQTINAQSVAYPGESFSGKVQSVDTRIDPVTRAINVRAVIDNSDLKLKPGMLLTLIIEKQTTNSIVIPETALIPIEDKQFVYIVQDNIAKRTEVKIAKRQPGVAKILSGLNVGDQLITEGTLRLRDGSKIKLKGSETKQTKPAQVAEK